MVGMAAARNEDTIGHVGIWARLARTALRIGAMMVEGLLVAGAAALLYAGGAALLGIGTVGASFAAAFGFMSCGIGMFISGVIAGFIGSVTGWNDYKEKKIQEMTEDLLALDITGKLGIKGAATVSINRQAAMRAVFDAGLCAKHSNPSPNFIAEGSDSVFIETGPAARKGDKLMCAASIATGSSDVFFGGEKTQHLQIGDDKDWWETGLEIVIGLSMGRGSFLGRLGCLGAGILGNMLGDYLGESAKWYIGYPVNPATGGKVLDGDIDTDFELPGPLPIEWRRFYSSHDHRTNTGHGKGWSTPYEIELHVVRPADAQSATTEDPAAGHLVFVNHQGRRFQLPMVEPGHALFNTVERFTVGCTPGGAFEVTDADHVRYLFGPAPSGGGGASPRPGGVQVLKVQRIRDRFRQWVGLRYDERQRLATITDHLGRILRLGYEDGSPRIRAISLVQAAPGERTGLLASYLYDAQGQLIQAADSTNRVTRRFAYADGLMTLQADAAGFECHYGWEDPAAASGPESEGWGERPPTPTGRDRRVTRHWTNDGELYDITYRFDEESGGGQTQATDQLGRHDRWAWDARYNLTCYQNTLGHQWHLAWNERRELLSATTPMGRTTRFQYDINGMQNAVTDPSGRQTRTLWDTNWFEPLAITTPDGLTWRFEYDAQGLLTSDTAPDGGTTQYAYDARGLPIQVIDAKGGKKTLVHDARGLLSEYTDCSGKTTRYTYDEWGNPHTVTDALGQVQRMGFNARSELLTMSLPDGSQQTHTYDDAGRLVAHTDGLSRASHYRHNTRGQLQWRIDAAQRQIAAAYDQAHRLMSLATENGVNYRFRYDEADRLVEEQRLDGTRIAVEYDADSEVVAVTHHPAAGDDVFDEIETQAMEGTLSQGSRSRQAIAPRRTEFIRDAMGQLVEKRTATQVLRYGYDGAGRLILAQRLKRLGQAPTARSAGDATAPMHTTRFEYDVAGNLTAEHCTDEATGQTHTLRHEHDALGNRTRTELPLIIGAGIAQRRLQRSLNYLHYGSGHLHQINLGLKALPNLGDDSSVAPPQPEAHRLIADLERDDLHREVARTQGSLATRYLLDPLGRKLGSWTRAGLSFAGGDNNGGNPSWQAEWRQQVERFGQPGGAGGGMVSGLVKAYRYDAVGELTRSLHSHKGHSQFDYDAVGRIQHTQRRSPAGQSQSERFAYDPAGNLLDALTANQAAPQGQARSQGYVRDNLVRVYEDKRYAYDGFGRLIQKRAGRRLLQRFEWDDHDQLVSVTSTRHPGTPQATTQVTRFHYDALGRRVGKQDAFGKTEFIWEGMRLIEERRGAQVTSYVYEPGSYAPLARIDALGNVAQAAPGASPGRMPPPSSDLTGVVVAQRPAANEEALPPSMAAPWGRGAASSADDGLATAAQIYHFHNDISGLPEELSDDQGQIRWRAAYRTWGNTQVENWEVVHVDGSAVHPSQIHADMPGGALEIEQNLRLQGQYLDRDTGLHYNTFRFYDPDIGRFISPDPIGLQGDANLHIYAPNPISWIDPWGWVHEKTSGYTVYALYADGVDPMKGEPYYIGITNDTEVRTKQHAKSGRLPPGAQLVPVVDGITYGQARATERALIEKYNTDTGTKGYNMKNKGTSYKQRGNRNLGFDTKSRTRRVTRQRYFNSYYRKVKSALAKC